MKTYKKLLLLTMSVIAILVTLSFCCCMNQEQKPATDATTMTKDQMIAQGKNLVTMNHCNDCHSTKLMTAQGPMIDSSHFLSGSPAEMKLPTIDTNQVTPGKWVLVSSDFTAWVGPWGVSYTANLTPDSATGTGAWTEDLFIKIIRSGKFMGVDVGRPIMPPMSAILQDFKRYSDQDIKCIFAYLHSLKPVKNRVHDYVPPTAIAGINN